MFSRFFIDRPIFATVLSLVITLAGAVSLLNLPLAMSEYVPNTFTSGLYVGLVGDFSQGRPYPAQQADSY